MKIRGQLKSIWPDRTQYKPYAYNLEMQDVFVEIEIPEEGGKKIEIVPAEGGVEDIVVLNLDGFSCLLGQVADSLDKLHGQYLKSFQR
jgi:hypothetical protein